MPEASYICYSCCATRFESNAEDPVCPNCGELVTNMLESNEVIGLTILELLAGLEQDHD